MFFDGEYSHAVLKKPAAGDFRVQEELGGHGEPREPSPAIVEQARRVLSHVAGPLLYARVDGIERDGGFVLMELEINEPFLYIGSSSGAAERFADAIVRRITETGQPAVGKSTGQTSLPCDRSQRAAWTVRSRERTDGVRQGRPDVALDLSSARSSPRVRPRLTIAIGRPASWARRTKRKPE